MLIELSDELWVDPELVMALKGAGEKQCTVYLYGLSEGIPVGYAAEDVGRAVNDALAEQEDPEEEEVDEDDEKEENK